MTIINTAPAEFQLPTGLLTPDAWGEVAGFLDGETLSHALAPALSESEQRDAFRAQVQSEYDRNLIIFWEAVGYALTWPNLQYISQRLHEIVYQHPGEWFNAEERTFLA